MDTDTLFRFVFEDSAIRGESVHLDSAWQAVLERHDYPAPVRSSLGELMASAVLLSATLKYEGSITLQIQGDGPINLMVVECTSERHLRGMAQWEGEVREGSSLRTKFGNARFVITLDPGFGTRRYQGIVELVGERLAEALEEYLQRSEQLPTRLWLAADGERAAGMLLQELPEIRDEAKEEAWNRLTILASTITTEELLELSQLEVIHRLFHEEDVRLFERELVSFRCSCSRERVETTLRGLGHQEVEELLRDEGEVSVTCRFCNQRYVFDAVDAEQLFTEQPQPAITPTRH